MLQRPKSVLNPSVKKKYQVKMSGSGIAPSFRFESNLAQISCFSLFLAILRQFVIKACLGILLRNEISHFRPTMKFHMEIKPQMQTLPSSSNMKHMLKPGFHIAVRCRKVADVSLLPFSICHAPRYNSRTILMETSESGVATIVPEVP